MRYENLLRANRESFALTQGEVAELLGLTDDAISRYENTESSPILATALGLELIFGRPLAQLFPDTRAVVADEMAKQFRSLSIKTENEEGANSALRKQFAAGLTDRLIRATSGA